MIRAKCVNNNIVPKIVQCHALSMRAFARVCSLQSPLLFAAQKLLHAFHQIIAPEIYGVKFNVCICVSCVE